MSEDEGAAQILDSSAGQRLDFLNNNPSSTNEPNTPQKHCNFYSLQTNKNPEDTSTTSSFRHFFTNKGMTNSEPNISSLFQPSFIEQTTKAYTRRKKSDSFSGPQIYSPINHRIEEWTVLKLFKFHLINL